MAQVPTGLELSDNVEELVRMSAWAAKLAEQIGANGRDAFRIDLALTEAVTNVMMHGLPGDTTRTLQLEAAFEENELSVTLTDTGIPFDPLSAEPKKAPQSIAEATPGGAGLKLIRAYCDSAHYAYTDGKNRLTLRFKCGSAKRHGGER